MRCPIEDESSYKVSPMAAGMLRRCKSCHAQYQALDTQSVFSDIQFDVKYHRLKNKKPSDIGDGKLLLNSEDDIVKARQRAYHQHGESRMASPFYLDFFVVRKGGVRGPEPEDEIEVDIVDGTPGEGEGDADV